MEKDQVKEDLNKQDLHKPVKPGRLQTQMLMESASAIANLLFTASERSEKVPEDWNEANTTISYV